MIRQYDFTSNYFFSSRYKAILMYSIPTQRNTKLFSFRFLCKLALISTIVIWYFIAPVKVHSEELEINKIQYVVKVQQREVSKLKALFVSNHYKISKNIAAEILSGES